MSTVLLNPNQQRRLGTHLRLLAEDLDRVHRLPELERPEAPSRAVRDLAADARRKVDALRAGLALPPDPAPSVRRRVAAIAEVWAARLEDLRARHLSAYGPVHPDLAPRLDPALEELKRLLTSLADATAALPER